MGRMRECGGTEGSHKCTRQHSPLEELKTSCLAEASSEARREVKLKVIRG